MNTLIERLEEDSRARKEALEIDSFIVEAPAGAGKTELLTQRVLRLLSVVNEPEEVLALTFTNKAATEMRDRILGRLEYAAKHEQPPEKDHERTTWQLARQVLAHDRERNWGLLAHSGRLRVTTLDALCASLARQMPYLSRFGSQPGVTDDASALYQAAARRTLELLEEEGDEAEVVAEALTFMANDAGRLERLIIAMLEKRDQWLIHAERIESGAMRPEVEAGFAALIERDLVNLRQLFDRRTESELMPLARFAAANVPAVLGLLESWETPLEASFDDLPRWRALRQLLLTGDGKWRSALNKNIGFPAAKEGGPDAVEKKAAMQALIADLSGITGLADALVAVDGMPSAEIGEAEWATVECFSRLLRLASRSLWLAFQEAGEVDFIEIASRAALALGDDEAPTDLALALDYRIRHLLVDEFQDTSPSQVELLEKLMRGWLPEEGRTVFVVGDPMQSIYRFRKADVGLFLRLRERGIGGVALRHLRLYRNNRSYPAVVAWVNRVFPDVFPKEDAPLTGAVRYADCAATRPESADAAVSIHPVIAGEGIDAAAAEAREVLALIRAARRADPKGRGAVLVRARSHLDAIVAEIRRHAPEMPFQAVDIEGLAERQPIQDLLTLYRALTHRADRIHWLALLRAPWCGLTLADLHALAAGDKRSTIWQLMHDETRVAAMSASGRERLLHVRGVLALAFAERDRQAPRRWLEGVWLMLGGPCGLPAESALADVEAFFCLVDRLAAANRLEPETLETQTAELFAPADPAGGLLQMMTIHKSKGLEFETVILPGLHRETGNNDSPLLRWEQFSGEDAHEHLLVAPMPPKGGRGEEDGPSHFDLLKRLEKTRAGHEDKRLLYVAVTRAIRRLHLVGCAVPDEKRDDGIKPPPAASLLRLLWDGVARAVFQSALGGEAPAATDPRPESASFVPPLLRLQQVEVPAVLRTLPSSLRPAANPVAQDAIEPLQSLEASVGTLVHRVLELIARQGLPGWTPERLERSQPAWRRWLLAQGHDAEAVDTGVSDVLLALRTTLASDTGRWILAPHEGAEAEAAWSSAEAERTALHVIDRSFIADGSRWIIDYKTVRVPESELAGRAEGFRPQLERYARLFAGEGLPLKLAIFFPLQGRMVELSAPALPAGQLSLFAE